MSIAFITPISLDCVRVAITVALLAVELLMMIAFTISMIVCLIITAV